MKKINLIFFWVVLITLMVSSCDKMEDINKDPNNPDNVPSHVLFSGAQKKIMDWMYDVWFSGRQCLLYSQYWAQRNYTEEDRYQIRESVNNSYFYAFYTVIANMDRVIKLNTDPETAPASARYGNNANQIAAAKIMRAWIFSVITDTWGDVPYSEAGKLKEGVYQTKYDDQAVIYEALIKELTDAANMIDESEPAFIGGDMIYDGDAGQWKKFANSLKCRLALHTSKVNANWKQYIAEAIASGVFESNDDVAAYHYATSPEHCFFYDGYFIGGRNDFTITRPFVDILKGQRDTLNAKTHPWEGTVDPRLAMYTNPRNGQYIGMPYGIPSSEVKAAHRNAAPNWYSAPPMQLQQDFPVPIMTYAEVLFILSEYNGFSAAEYEEGVEASLDYWSAISGKSVSAAAKTAYLNDVTATVNAETVALQKYIDLFMNGTEAWVEIRRTGYPDQLLKPEEWSIPGVPFTPLSETKRMIISRVKYPTNESNLNGAAFNAAVAKLQDGTNNYYSQMFWDKRTLAVPHPANK